jgi:polyphosphate kinase 2 (PPK2 family)
MNGFDLENPKLDRDIKERALESGGYPYDDTLDTDRYEAHLRALQIELVKLQSHLIATGERVLALFEGRDAAGISSAMWPICQRAGKSHCSTAPGTTGPWWSP